MLIQILLILFWLATYFLIFFCVTKLNKTNQLKYENFPALKLIKTGIVFHSYNTHRIRLLDLKPIKIGNVLYLKTPSKLVSIFNVKDVKTYNNYLYFKANGKVEIKFNCKDFYKYFAIQIKSNQFNIEETKQQAIIDLINCNFEINFSNIAKRYIKIIKNVLNINIFEEKIIIKQNKFKLSYVLTYKLNNTIKRININETL